MNDFLCKIYNWIYENRSWLFEGAGLTIVLAAIGFFWKKRSNKNNENEKAKKIIRQKAILNRKSKQKATIK